MMERKKVRRKFSMVVITFLLLTGISSLMFFIELKPGNWLASASPSTEVRLDAETYTFFAERGIGMGYRFNTTVELYDVTELFAWDVRIYFNNTLLNATNAYYHPEEPLHTIGGYPVNPSINNDYNETHGYVSLGISAIYPNYVNVTKEDYPLGIGICIMEFEILMKPSAGKTLDSNLILNNPYTYLLWKDGSTEIACTKKNGLYRLISANIKVPIDYPTIQEAINAANIGNTIFVYNGTYPENVVINKTLILVGQSSGTTIVNGSTGTTVYVNATNDVFIDGFTITSADVGIRVWNSLRINILNNKIIGTNYGIDAGAFAGSGAYVSSDDGLVTSNNITSNNYGIYAYVHADAVYNFASGAKAFLRRWAISDNEIIGNEHGIYVHAYAERSAPGWGEWAQSYVQDWIVHDNHIADNVRGIDVMAHVGTWNIDRGAGKAHIDGWMVISNNCTENNNGIYATAEPPSGGACSVRSWNVYENTITLSKDIALFTEQLADNWTIHDNDIAANMHGIYLRSPSNVLRENRMINNTYNFGVSNYYLQNVSISNTINGKPIYYLINWNCGQVPSDAGYIALVDSANITIANINLSQNEQGIILIQTQNITLENINASNNVYGIYLQESTNFTIFSTQAVNNTYGIYLQNSANGTLSGNMAISNTYSVSLKSSTNCTITGTNVEENEYGIYVSETSGNLIYHNNFVRNNQHAAIDGTFVNIWDNGYPSGGNYWSNHTGPDECKGIYQNETGSDGIVDADMTIDQNNIDYYPLSALWSSPINIIMPGNTTHRTKHHLPQYEQNITLTFTLEFDASWIGYSLDGEANVTITGNTTFGIPSCGYHHIVVYANDTFGNMYSSAKAYFTITFLTDLNYDKIVNVKDLAKTTYAYGSLPGDLRWNVVADVNRDGIIDIEDIAIVAIDYGKTW